MAGIADFKAAKADAKRVLFENCPAALTGPIAERANSIRAIAARPTTNRGKLAQLAIAYALFVFYGRANKLMTELTGATVPRNNVPRAIRVFVEALFPTDGGISSAKSYSRWTKAIEYLRSNRILPSAVGSLAKQPGEGINKWSRGGASASPLATANAKTSAIVTIRIGQGKRGWKISEANMLAAVEAALVGATPMRIKSKAQS